MLLCSPVRMGNCRKIIHVDMDCFYAAIECRDDPSVAHLPVGVGGDSGRGVLTTCNYVARQYGCRSAMPLFRARQLCPQLVLKPLRSDVYRAESRRIRAIFRKYTELIEPLSLDEAYLDVSHHQRFAWDIAREIRQTIRRETGLTASAGIAANKMLAKIASDWRKPNGQFAIQPQDVSAFMQSLPLRKIPGVGPKGEARLTAAGLKTCGDLQKLSRHEVLGLLGQAWGEELYVRCRGEDDRPVESTRIRKSLSCERTFLEDLTTLEACRHALDPLLAELAEDLRKRASESAFRKIFLKLKFANFQSTTKEGISGQLDRTHFEALLAEAFGRSPHAVRLIGVGVRFPEPDEEDHRQLRLDL